MQAGYDYMLVRNHLQHRAWKVVGLSLFALGTLMLLGGSAYYAYAAKARSDLDQLNTGVLEAPVTAPLDQGLDGVLVSDRPVDSADTPEASTNLRVDTADTQQLSPLVASPLLRIPVATIANQRLYPGEFLQANSWSNPWAYEPPSFLEQALLRKFTPINMDQALPVGSQAAPTRLLVPAIGVDSSVTALEILDLGDSRTYATPKHTIGHIPESANPGEAGSAWFFGHLESPIMQEGAVFRDLPRIPGLLRRGESVYIIADNNRQQFLYKITSTQVVHQNDMRLYDTGQATIHLVACVPTLVYDHRLIVTGQLVGIR
jgi:LPXTG-site transpeptidase (sortase) family protein